MDAGRQGNTVVVLVSDVTAPVKVDLKLVLIACLSCVSPRD